MKTIKIKYRDSKGTEQGMQVPDGPRASFCLADGAIVEIFQGDYGIVAEIKAAPPALHDDAHRLDFMETHGLYASPNDSGEWQVWESTPRHYSDGCATRNAFLPSMRAAIDYAMDHFPDENENDANEYDDEYESPPN